MSCCLVNLQITSPQGTSPWHRRMIKPGCFTHKIHEAESFSFSGQLWLISPENPTVCKHWCPAAEDLVAQVSGSEAWGLNSLKLLIRESAELNLLFMKHRNISNVAGVLVIRKTCCLTVYIKTSLFPQNLLVQDVFIYCLLDGSLSLLPPGIWARNKH